MTLILELGALVSPTVILCGLASLFWRKRFLPYMAEQTSALMEQQVAARLEARVTAATVAKELTRNGGDSVKDLVATIRPNHQEAQRHWEKIEGRLTTMEGEMQINTNRLTVIEEGNRRAGQILDVAFRHAPIEQQRAVEEFIRKLPPQEGK